MHLDPMGVVHEPVEDVVGQSGISYLFVRPRDRQLRGQNHRAHPIAVLADLPEVATLGLQQRRLKLPRPKRQCPRLNLLRPSFWSPAEWAD